MRGFSDATVMARATYEEQVLQMLGDPGKVDRELRAFRKNARILSAKRRHLLQRYPEQWIGIHQGRVSAQAGTLPELVDMMDSLGIPRGRAIVRFISKHPRKMIL